MALMYWMGSRPQVLDNGFYAWIQSRFIFFLLIPDEDENNAVFFGCNF